MIFHFHEGNEPLDLDSPDCDPDRETDKFRESLKIAACIDTQFAQLIHKGKWIPRKREMYGADFWLPGAASMSTVLVEVGFMTNRHDMDMLAQEEYRQLVAKALYQAVVEYKRDQE